MFSERSNCLRVIFVYKRFVRVQGLKTFHAWFLYNTTSKRPQSSIHICTIYGYSKKCPIKKRRPLLTPVLFKINKY